MRILELCLSPDLGGLELYSYHCVKELSKQHFVLAVIHPAGRLRQYYDTATQRIETLATSFKALPLRAALVLARHIDNERIDVMHVHWGKDLPLAALAKALSRRKPRLVSTRHMAITRPKNDPYHRFIYARINLIIAITKGLERDLKKFLPPDFSHKLTTLYHGVEASAKRLDAATRQARRAELGYDTDSFVAGIFGRIKRAKGQYLLIEAIQRLRDKGRDIHGLIVGHPMEPAYFASLKQDIETRGMSQIMRFMGFVDQPQEWMQLCDAVVLASHGETFGLVLVEAMQAGVAVIGSSEGGVLEIIDDGETGLLFRAGDSVTLATQLEKLMDDSALRQRLARAGQTKAAEVFNYQRHFARLSKLLAGEQAV